MIPDPRSEHVAAAPNHSHPQNDTAGGNGSQAKEELPKELTL
jgi:hypothetical protein